jgi:hypothetical protein
VFELIDQIVRRAGGTLANLVTMTVFIKEPRYGDRFVELRKQKFPKGNYPGSALITVTNLARPGMEIEIQAVAVIGDRAQRERAVAKSPGIDRALLHSLLKLTGSTNGPAPSRALRSPSAATDAIASSPPCSLA